jgi:hypothetical protein
LSITAIRGSHTTWGHGCLSLVNVVCCHVEVPVSGRSHVGRSPTREVAVTKRPLPTKGCCDIKNCGGCVVILTVYCLFSACLEGSLCRVSIALVFSSETPV